MTNEDDILRYDKLVEAGLRGVVRKAVEEVIQHGLKGDHHFYITFLTDYPGVKIPSYLRERYPGEMTIVLQYQFSDLAVNDEKLEVTLSFNNVPERLVVPLGSISIFADPSVNFALQFQPSTDDAEEDALLREIDSLTGGDDDPDGSGGGKKGKPQGSGEVISLDRFRKK